MSFYDYKVVPAPRRARKVKGISGVADLFALTLTETINEIARQGWEYYRSESLAIAAPAGWFRRGTVEEQVMLVFRKPREHLSPRLAAVPVETPRETAADAPPADRTLVAARREPLVGDAPAAVATPLRATPRLGPADQA